MKLKKTIIVLFLIIIIFVSIGYLARSIFFPPSRDFFYKTCFPQKKDLRQIIYASGKLEIKNNIKVGSLVAGTIQSILVKENDTVKKGQILTIIDNGKSDTQVRKYRAGLEIAKLDLEYKKKYYERQKALFSQNQISLDFFQQVTTNVEKLKQEIKAREADLELEEIEFNNTKIKAPEDGVIVSIGITKGMKITTDLDATVLFEIAKDIKKMEAKLDIDESDIGQIKIGQKVKFAVSTYLDKSFDGLVTEISYSPQMKNGIIFYKACVSVENKNNLLLPGMRINAKIKVAKSKDCLAIENSTFQIDKQNLKEVAQKLNFKLVAISKKEKKEIEKNNKKEHSIRYVWTIKDNAFIEQAVKVNITGDNYSEIISKADFNNNILAEILEIDEMEKLYNKMFKGIF